MNSKHYEKPTMKVVKLQHHGMLMTSGEVGAKSSINNWGDGGKTEEDIYM